MMPDVDTQKTIVRVALNYFTEMMRAGGTEVYNPRLDAVDYDVDSDLWFITVSYVDQPASPNSFAALYGQDKRVYVRVTVAKDEKGLFVAAGMNNTEAPTIS